MMDFDSGRAERAARDQGFRLGGEEFRVRTGVHPSVLGDYEEAVLTGREDLLSSQDDAVKAFLWDDEARDRWDALRARKEDPVTAGDIRAVIQYLYEVESELPTSAPAPSSRGRDRTKPSSAAERSSPVGAAS